MLSQQAGRSGFGTCKTPNETEEQRKAEDRATGVSVGDVWTDIPPINSQARERLGYPTQKPLPLLERLIAAASNEGDLVLDPFCGCGTTAHAAEKLAPQWVAGGARIVGGCCRVTPADITAIAQAVSLS